MNQPVPTCHYCKLAMEPGHELQRRSRARWVEGEPEFDPSGMSKVTGKKMDWISEYRCPGCGLIEKFANQPFPRPAPWPIVTVEEGE